MVTRILYIILFLLALSPTAHAVEVMILSSGKVQPYIAASLAVEEQLKHVLPARGVKSIESDDIVIYHIDKTDDFQSVDQKIEQEDPSVVVAVGRKAYEIGLATGRPLVYLLVPKNKIIHPLEHEVTGVILEQDSLHGFSYAIQILSQFKRIGVVYNPEDKGGLVVEVTQIWPNLTFVTAPVLDPKDTVKQLEEDFSGKIDLLWMVPDISTLTKQTEHIYYRFSLEQKIPILTFSPQYLDRGATFAAVFDITSMAKKAGEFAVAIIGGLSAQSIPPAYAEKIVVKMNKKTADKINLKFVVPAQ